MILRLGIISMKIKILPCENVKYEKVQNKKKIREIYLVFWSAHLKIFLALTIKVHRFV